MAALSAVLCAGCAMSHELSPDLPAIGSSGGWLASPWGGDGRIGQVGHTIPAGALSDYAEISMIVTGEPVPESFIAYSPVIQFEPEGLTFAVPITIRQPFVGNPSFATVFWTEPGTDTYVAVPTEVVGSEAVAQTTHLGRTFVGACRGDGC
jgi:hypothetical protein